MRKLIVAVAVPIIVALFIVSVLSSCGGPSAPATVTKTLQTQVSSDIKDVSAAYDCQFVEKSLTLLGSFKATQDSLKGDTIYVYVVTYTYTCQDKKGGGDVVYFVTVDKSGKVVAIA